MQEKKNFRAETIEQTNLLTDPFGLTVLSTLKTEEYLTVEEISKLSGEEPKLIDEYIKLFLDEKMIKVKEEKGIAKYCKMSDYYSFSPELLSIIPDQIQDHIIFGLLHAIQGDYYDLLKLAQKHDNLDKALEEAGYPESKKSLDLLMGRIYIKEEDIEDIEELVNKLMNKYKKIPEGENPDDYLAFDLNFFMKPSIAKFIENIKE